MSTDKGQRRAPDKEIDSAEIELGPAEKLRDLDDLEFDLSVPGAQNPDSEEIKNEKNFNTE